MLSYDKKPVLLKIAEAKIERRFNFQLKNMLKEQ